MIKQRKGHTLGGSGDDDEQNRSNGHTTDNIKIQHKTMSQVDENTEQTSSGAIAATILSPALLTTFVLIFGGCCSNVYTLESILTLSPASGSLITFLQFFLTALFTLPSQLTRTDSSSVVSAKSILPRLRPLRIPVRKWLLYTTLFLTVNVLNNNAFNYRISVPLHIILRSAGPVTSMAIGYLFMSRRYPMHRIVAVLILFSGVVLAALADASSKGKTATPNSNSQSDLSKQLPGFALLFSALVISAFMGIYTDEIYQKYGRDGTVANENLFYSHLLSLPFFAAQYRSLWAQFLVMSNNASLRMQDRSVSTASSLLSRTSEPRLLATLRPILSYLPSSTTNKVLAASHVSQAYPILLLTANAFTQIICITGVNRLSTQTTSLTVSVVLNVRKLVSLILSIWLFGNTLPTGVLWGAVLVFVGGGLYSLPRSKSKGKDGKDQ